MKIQKAQRFAWAVTVSLSCAPAFGGQGADLLRHHLYAGTLNEGLEALQPLAAGGEAEAQFGLGVLTFFTAIEGLAQALYRHGLAGPETGPMGPDMALPMPSNSEPEPLDYETTRTIIAALVTTMDEAKTTLIAASESGEFAVPLDPLQIRIDVNGDGRGDETESLAGFISAGDFGLPTGQVEPILPDSKNKSGKTEQPAPAKDLVLAFDRADAIWLAGYSQVFALWGDFFLAHDYSDFVNAAFHRVFPKAGLPMQDYASGGSLMMDPLTDTAIADAIAAIHTLNWPVVEPARLKLVLERARGITQLSRENWKAILAETDDDREWIPSPRQTPFTPDAVVTEEMVMAWHDTLDKVDLILAGELLIPHWRFSKGFDLHAYLGTAKRTDLVMLLTGYGALPFLGDGPIADAELFGPANSVFGESFLNYMVWFN